MVGHVRRLHVERLVPADSPRRAGRRSARCRGSWPHVPPLGERAAWRVRAGSPDGVQLGVVNHHVRGVQRRPCHPTRRASGTARRLVRAELPSAGRDGPRRHRRAAGQRARHERAGARRHADRGARPVGDAGLRVEISDGSAAAPGAPPPRPRWPGTGAACGCCSAMVDSWGAEPVAGARPSGSSSSTAEHEGDGHVDRTCRTRRRRAARDARRHRAGRAAERAAAAARRLAPARRGAAARVPPGQPRRRRARRTTAAWTTWSRTPRPARRSRCSSPHLPRPGLRRGRRRADGHAPASRASPASARCCRCRPSAGQLPPSSARPWTPRSPSPRRARCSTPPTQPEIRSFRRWVCAEVRAAERRAAPPTPWADDAEAPAAGGAPETGWEVDAAVTHGPDAGDRRRRHRPDHRDQRDRRSTCSGTTDADELVGRPAGRRSSRRASARRHLAGFTPLPRPTAAPRCWTARCAVPALRRDGSEIRARAHRRLRAARRRAARLRRRP